MHPRMLTTKSPTHSLTHSLKVYATDITHSHPPATGKEKGYITCHNLLRVEISDIDIYDIVHLIMVEDREVYSFPRPLSLLIGSLLGLASPVASAASPRSLGIGSTRGLG